jgi:hypothetical protein
MDEWKGGRDPFTMTSYGAWQVFRQLLARHACARTA